MDQASLGPLPGSAAPEDPNLRRACDQCRQRKIRCDKDTPCSNCRTANRICTSTGVGQRHREPRQRVLISSQYERKIDKIEARLANIESLLSDLASRNDSGGEFGRLGHTPQSVTNIPTASASTAGYESSDNESAFGGDSIFAAQTTFASELLEHAVERTSLRDVNPNIESALTNLKQLVDLQKRQSISHGPRFPLQQPIPQGGLSQMKMPPMDLVVSLLKQIRVASPGLFTFVCYFVGVLDFSNLCRMVYFPAEDFSDAIFTIVNAGLYSMFSEQHSLASDKAIKEEYAQYIHMCRVNLETSLANLPLFMSAKVENVKALLLGTLYAIDLARPSVAWSLNSAAAQLCQTGGFHRSESVPTEPDTFNVKSVLFWHVYTIDKALCLRLGRASMIQDWDISIPFRFNYEGLMGFEVSGVPTMWLKTGTLQGKIYEQLYSPAALARPHAVLAERARVLAAECRKIEVESSACRNKAIASLERMKASHLVDIHVKGDEVQVLSTLTLVYRALPAPEGSVSRFCDECVDAARRAIQKHLACMELVIKDAIFQTVYLHWNLLLTPFAPFFVLFCFVIETLSPQDLELLKEFCSTLEATYGSSEAAEKLWRLCNVMCNVAMLYVEAKSQQQEDQTMIPIGDEFDMYLSQLGIMPNEEQGAMAFTGDPSGAVAGNHQVAQMAEWFSGSRNLMGLLEQDLSQIGGPNWQQQQGM